MGYSNLKSATVSRYFEDKDVKGETNEYLSYIMSKIKNSSMRNYKKDSELAVQMEIFLNDLKQIANPNITLGDVLTKKNEDEYILTFRNECFKECPQDTEKIEVNAIIDPTKEYKVKLNYCPKCKSRLDIDATECPSCGINIKEYLYNN